MNNLLIYEPPLQVLPSLACKVGLNEAVVLQQFHYWLKASKNERDGYKWIYNSYKEWNKQFPFWSEITLKRAILKLEKEGYLISGNYNKAGFDKTKWYRIDYTKLMNDLCSDMIQPSYQNDTRSVSKRYDASYQNDMTYTNRIPETTTETTTKRNIKESSEQLSAGTSSDHIPYSEIIDYFNKKAGTHYRASSQKTRKLIRARFNEKFTLDDFKQVIDTKTSQWLDDPKMDKYLRPETLFGTKFENYLNEKPKKEPMSNVDWTDVW